MISDLAIGPYSGKETGESALLRELLERLNPGDILLADRYFCSYFMVCLLLTAKVDFVTRLHQRRTADFRRGQRLGAGDHVVAWSRPERPEWMDQSTYEQMPKSLELREVEVAVAQPGFRTAVLVVVTTLTDGRRTRAAIWRSCTTAGGWPNSHPRHQDHDGHGCAAGQIARDGAP